MPILQQLHKIYTNNLMGNTYEIIYEETNGSKKKLKLKFKKEHLKHILGLHKIPPYNQFITNANKKRPRYPADMIYRHIKNKKITLADIMNKTTSEEVLIRSIHFLEMGYLLNDKLTEKIYIFDKNTYHTETGRRTQIKSDYLLYVEKNNFSLYLGLKITKNSLLEAEVVPETWFFRETKGSDNCDDYIKGQISYNVCSITKI